MAPPARHTKSAAWALTTRTLLSESICPVEFILRDQRSRVDYAHAPDLLNGESRIQQDLRKHDEALGYRRVDRLAEVGRKNAAFRTHLANAVQHHFPGRFAGMHGGEAMLDECTHFRQFELFGGP